MRKVLLGVGVVLVLLVLIAFMLPSQVSVHRSKVIAASASQIQPYVTSVQNWSRWSPWNRRDPEMQITYGTVTEGEGANWSWKSKSEGNGKMTLTVVRPDTVGTLLDFEGHGTANSGFSFKPEGNNTLVTWWMTCEMGNNPLMRYMGLMMDSMVGEDYEKGLDNLKTVAERGPVSAD